MKYSPNVTLFNAFRVSLDPQKFPGFFALVMFPNSDSKFTSIYLGHETFSDLLFIESAITTDRQQILCLIEKDSERTVMDYVLNLSNDGCLPENLIPLYEQACENNDYFECSGSCDS